jgi:hypothetical protein
MSDRFHKHDKARRQVLAALDLELAKLKHTIRATDIATIGLDVRGSQLEELHRLRCERLDLFNEELSPRYRLQQPSATWSMR